MQFLRAVPTNQFMRYESAADVDAVFDKFEEYLGDRPTIVSQDGDVIQGTVSRAGNMYTIDFELAPGTCIPVGGEQFISAADFAERYIIKEA